MSDIERQLFQGILCKFLLNLPKEEMEDLNRLSYNSQKAFYYYIDEILHNKQIKDWEKQRSEFLFKLKTYSPACLKIHPPNLIAKLSENKPVCGAIIFNSDSSKILVIKVRDKWGFPKGKWNQSEKPEQCAIREVQEETGINIANKIQARTKIEFDTHGGTAYFYVAKGVSEQERIKLDSKELDDIVWMKLEDVRKNQQKFVQKSRIAWGYFQKDYLRGRQAIDQFMPKYSKKDHQIFDYGASPLLKFKLDRKRLSDILG